MAELLSKYIQSKEELLKRGFQDYDISKILNDDARMDKGNQLRMGKLSVVDNQIVSMTFKIAARRDEKISDCYIVLSDFLNNSGYKVKPVNFDYVPTIKVEQNDMILRIGYKDSDWNMNFSIISHEKEWKEEGKTFHSWVYKRELCPDDVKIVEDLEKVLIQSK